MEQKYQTWIDSYNQKFPDFRGTCELSTNYMLETFPELVRVRGFVHHVLSVKPSEHWWLEDVTGNIIDPTAKQFVCIIKYEKWDEKQDEPTGKCLNCGNYCYHGQSTCSKRCTKEFKTSLTPQIDIPSPIPCFGEKGD